MTRVCFYTLKLMEDQIRKGFVWDEMREDIKKIVGIFILGEKIPLIDKPLTHAALCDVQTGRILYDIIHFYFISLHHVPENADLITLKDIWLELLKNLGSMERIDPSVYARADAGLLQLIKMAEVSALSEQEYKVYEASMKSLADEMDMEKHGYRKGMAEGMEKGMAEGMEKGLAEGMEKGKLAAYTEIVLSMTSKGQTPSKIATLLEIDIQIVEEILKNRG